jgi:hypothetical protein
MKNGRHNDYRNAKWVVTDAWFGVANTGSPTSHGWLVETLLASSYAATGRPPPDFGDSLS